MTLSNPTMATLLAAGLIFLLALVLGIWKYRQMATSPDHLAHPYVDIAHRSALGGRPLAEGAVVLQVLCWRYGVHPLARRGHRPADQPTFAC